MQRIVGLFNYLRNPHGHKIEQHKKRYQELDELSNVAVQIGDAAAYRSLQAEMREVFFDYLTAVAVNTIYNLIPHVLIIWLISLVVPTITIPLVNWEIHIFAAYLLAYLTYFLSTWVLRFIKRKRVFQLNPAGVIAQKQITN
ncbi:MAG: hypothetical protein ACOY35_00770 [Bacillota bacterium]